MSEDRKIRYVITGWVIFLFVVASVFHEIIPMALFGGLSGFCLTTNLLLDWPHP